MAITLMNKDICSTSRKKHLLLVFFIIFIIFGLNSRIADAEVSDSVKIDFLVQRGASQEVLEKLSQKRLDKIYNEVVEEDLYCKSYKQNVIKEIPSDSIMRGVIEPSELNLICIADFYVRNDNTISRAVVEYEGKWEEGRPYIWAEDAVTFNWDSNKFLCEFAEFYSEYYLYSDEQSAHTAYYIENPAYAALQGLGYYVDLRRFDNVSYETISHAIQHRGFYGIIDFVPSDTIVANANTYFGTTLNYAHNKNPLPVSISVSIAGVNVAIEESVLVDTIGQNFAFKLE